MKERRSYKEGREKNKREKQPQRRSIKRKNQETEVMKSSSKELVKEQ